MTKQEKIAELNEYMNTIMRAYQRNDIDLERHSELSRRAKKEIRQLENMTPEEEALVFDIIKEYN